MQQSEDRGVNRHRRASRHQNVAPQSRQAWGKLLAPALCLVWLVATFVLVAPRALGQVPVVNPGDVTTPTPAATAGTPPLLTLPTPTPTSGPLPLLPTPTPDPRSTRMIPAATSASAYRVREGDTLWSVALETGVDLEEVPCMVAPTFRPDEPLVVGQLLEMLPLGWSCHRADGSESLGEIAARYGLSPQTILDVAWNHAGLQGMPGDARPLFRPAGGVYLRIPAGMQSAAINRPAAPGVADGFLGFMLQQPIDVAPVTAYAVGGPRATTVAAIGPVPKDWPFGSGNFTWPVYGWLSQGYRDDHRAIDIAAAPGTLVAAADRGVVIRAGWNDQGYGLFVVIDHNIDYITLYSHLKDVFVREGEVVAQGQIIGTVGSTGNSTGPHLHFEIRDFGRRTNPLGLLAR